ncbi:Glycosyltransferase Gtf1 [bioreactor metagenome]|jgi:Glycosyltransferase|uniref:Glycosyltransferase Gtf1 n=1 Tax=bioreactor metagenome TaxID=1076179 RepID=A0A644V286_9ZZZZ|nr:glycosyltransferase [Acidaminococcaceae bacterium]
MNIVLLCFGISSIASVSGLEKVFVSMANEFLRRGHQVTAVWNDEQGVKPFYHIDDGVNCINLGLGKIKAPLAFRIIREVNKGLRLDLKNKVDEYKTQLLCYAMKHSLSVKPDVFICYEFNSVMVANVLSEGEIPVIAMVHNSIDNQIGMLTPKQRKEASRATVYQVLMPEYVKQAQQLLSTRIEYIPNIVLQVKLEDHADLSIEKEQYIITHIGRIEGRQKRQAILAGAFAAVAKAFPKWILQFYGPVGDESYKKMIEAYIAANGLEKQIFFKGITENPLKILQHSDIFPFPSAYEGFPLALTEAMAVGLPTIGFRNAPAVGGLICNGENGYVCDTKNEFAKQLEILMQSKEKRITMGRKASKSMEKFAPDIVWNRWESLLEEIAYNKK